MSLRHTILGFLKNGPKTGYDLQKKIETTISHFWPSTQSQVYRTLNELAREDCIVSEIQYQDEKPNKKVYTITGKGTLELQDWLTTPLSLVPHRNQFLVQLFFSRYLSIPEITANLEHYNRELEKREDFLHSDEVKAMLQYGSNEKEKVLFQIIVDNGLRVLASEREWVNKSVEILKNTEGV